LAISADITDDGKEGWLATPKRQPGTRTNPRCQVRQAAGSRMKNKSPR